MRTLVVLVFSVIVVACSPQKERPASDGGSHLAPAIVGVTAPASLLLLGPVPKPTSDTRTSDELAQAACLGADGRWRCERLARKMVLASNASSPIIPSSWTIPAWYIDASNTTGCASDANSGTSATCSAGGIGPLVTFQELGVHRWGCLGAATYCPRLQQATQVYALSSDTTSDPWDINLKVEAASPSFVINGSLGLTTVGTGTLGTVTAKNRSTPQLLNAVLTPTGGAVAAGQFIVNSTHSSVAWIYADVSGSTWAISQPMQPPAVPLLTPLAEVDTWASGDSYTLYTLPAIYMTRDAASMNYVGAGKASEVYQVSIDPVGFHNLKVGGDGSFAAIEAQIGAAMGVTSLINGALDFENCDFFSPSGAFPSDQINAQQQGLGNTGWFAGQIRGSGPPIGALDLNIDYDAIIGTSDKIVGSFDNYRYVYVDTGASLIAHSGVSYPHGGAVIWGPGDVLVQGTARLYYPAGAGSASATFLNTGGLLLNGQALGCVAKPSSSTITCNTTISAANLDANLGATSGCIGVIDGASFCNFGP